LNNWPHSSGLGFDLDLMSLALAWGIWPGEFGLV